MGKIKKGVMGGFVGYVGSVSGFNSPGKEMIRTKKSKLKPDNKVKDQEQNTQFATLSELYKYFGPQIKHFFESIDLGHLNTREIFFKTNLGQGFTYENQLALDLYLDIPNQLNVGRMQSNFYTGNNSLRCRITKSIEIKNLYNDAAMYCERFQNGDFVSSIYADLSKKGGVTRGYVIPATKPASQCFIGVLTKEFKEEPVARIMFSAFWRGY